MPLYSEILWTEREAHIFDTLRLLSAQYGVQRLVLFGSRARRTHTEKSDIDLAVYGCEKFRDFSFAVDEEVDTLLSFDLVHMDETVSPALRAEIERDGVILYEAL